MDKKIEKPKDYQKGGQQELNRFMGGNLTQIITIISIVIWVISSGVQSVKDIFSGGIQEATSSYSFIMVVIMVTTLQIKLMINKRPKIKKDNTGCKKCGKK